MNNDTIIQFICLGTLINNVNIVHFIYLGTLINNDNTVYKPEHANQ